MIRTPRSSHCELLSRRNSNQNFLSSEIQYALPSNLHKPNKCQPSEIGCWCPLFRWTVHWRKPEQKKTDESKMKEQQLFLITLEKVSGVMLLIKKALCLVFKTQPKNFKWPAGTICREAIQFETGLVRERMLLIGDFNSSLNSSRRLTALEQLTLQQHSKHEVAIWHENLSQSNNKSSPDFCRNSLTERWRFLSIPFRFCAHSGKSFVTFNLISGSICKLKHETYFPCSFSDQQHIRIINWKFFQVVQVFPKVPNIFARDHENLKCMFQLKSHKEKHAAHKKKPPNGRSNHQYGPSSVCVYRAWINFLSFWSSCTRKQYVTKLSRKLWQQKRSTGKDKQL